ncbi:hypothetical protein AB4Y45_32805 [Paraburkholderia sp. EG287A]|uniref:hypothetical protein n=1 Tax=Paraburkholderia sp. EG287A TaxID=3237012 RepID=UPI0034D37D51
MKELTADIDLDHEVAAVASFISLKWTAISNVQAMVAEIRTVAERYARSLFEHHALWLRAKELLDARKALLEQTSGLDPRVGLDYYDAVCVLLDHVQWSAEDIGRTGRAMLGNWDLDAPAKRLATSLEERYPDLTFARPRGWADLESGYVEYAGQEEYNPQPDRDAFHGSRVEGARSDTLPGRLALPYVICDEKCRGRKASVALVGTVLAQFMGITEFLNTQRLVNDLAPAIQGLDTPVVVFKRPVVSTTNPFLKVAFETVPAGGNRADLEKAIARLAETDAMSDEQKAQKEAERDAWVEKFVLTLKDTSEEDQKKRAAEMERYSVLLSKALEG